MRLVIIVLVILLSLATVPGILVSVWKGGGLPWQRLEKFSDANNRKSIGSLCCGTQRRREKRMGPTSGRLRNSCVMMVIVVMVVLLGK